MRGDNNCVSADQYALTGSISAVPARSLDEQPKPKPIANSDSSGASAVTPAMTHGQTEHSVSRTPGESPILLQRGNETQIE